MDAWGLQERKNRAPNPAVLVSVPMLYWQLLQLQLVALATLVATAAGTAGQGRPQPTLVHDPMVSTAAPLYLDGAGK